MPIAMSHVIKQIYNSNKPRTKAVLPRVDMAQQGVEAPIPLGGRFFPGFRRFSAARVGDRFTSRIIDVSFLLLHLRRSRDENGDPWSRCRPAPRGSPTLYG